MSDEQQQKDIRPTKKFGSIQQQRDAIQEFSTIGTKGKPMPVETAIPAADVDTSATEMKRQTVYMPQELATWLKVHAALTHDDISGIITRLVEQLRDQVEGKRP